VRPADPAGLAVALVKKIGEITDGVMPEDTVGGGFNSGERGHR
jgi:hypothetical protein